MIPLFGDSRTDGAYYKNTFADPTDISGVSQALRDTAGLGTMTGFGADTPAQLDAQRGVYDFSRVAQAAFRAQVLVENTFAREAALEEAAERRIKAIKDATGVALVNPALQVQGGTMDGFLPPGTVEPPPDPLATFDARRVELAAAYPDKADAIRADLGLVDEARALGRAAQRDLAQVSAEVGGATALLGGFGGAIGGTFRDPLQVSLLFAGGGAGTAATALGRVAQVALREALISAGGAALSQPAVQAWRAEIGAESGLVPALENIGLALLFGGIAGSVIEGGREGFKALRAADKAAVEKVLAGTATPKEAEAALRAVGADPEFADELAAAARASEADGALAKPPRDVAEGLHREAQAQALMRAETGDVLMQEPVFPVRAGVTDDAALAVLERDDLDAVSALRALRTDPDLVESALSSASPAVREAGQVALLGDEAFAAIEAGAVDPRYGALVQRAVVEPERQAALMAELEMRQPRSVAEAREIIGDAVAAESAQRVAARIAGERAPYDPAAVEPPRVFDPGGRADGDILRLTPGETAEGKAAMVPSGSFEIAGARERFLNDLVSACNI